ncbi:ATP-binding protein [Streptomyces sp. V1I1]|uniref:ATP-binding protein n=1 Tax=Streptomyces sp. V1I1 TaxID=3042272 RepID=UPI002788DC2C|nr:ATP-binding protein [Streptomyces sp. V1I1]MDQ0943153.1 anti-sigma regulatory factor (Ser/Thr protein kinase) [Streptomyces sp. V1I1]
MTASPQPWCSRLDLACEEAGVRFARAHARDVLAKWTVPDETADTAVLIVSELVTNAVRHAKKPTQAPPWATTPPPGQLILTLWHYPQYLLIYVYDQDRTPPMLRPTAADGQSGRGLHLVDRLSAEWGYLYPTPHSGKTVYAKLILPGNPVPSDVVRSAAELQLPRQQGPGYRHGPHMTNRAMMGLPHG